MTSFAMDQSRPPTRSPLAQRPGYGSLRAALVSLAVVAGIELVNRLIYPLPNPGVFLLLAVFYVAMTFGLAASLVSAAVCLAYAAYTHSAPGTFLRFYPPDAIRMVILLGALPVAGLMGGQLRRRADRAADAAGRREREAADLRIIEQIEAQRQRMQELVDNVAGIVLEAYHQPSLPAGRVNFVNHHVERMLGYTVDEWLADPGLAMRIVHPDDRERVEREMSEVPSRGYATSVFRWRRRDGRELWVEAKCTAIRDASGAVVGMRGVIMDITRVKRALAALRRRAGALVRVARQLKRSNQELDQFAYVTSHDLRAPLRGIANLSRWIEEDIGEHFTAETHRQMELLRGRVDRMEKLIDGLLQYSRVGRIRVASESVDVGKLVRDVVDLLAPPKGFTVEIAPGLPTIHTQRLRLEQVFMNLIGNAFKHHHRADGRVTVGCREVERMYEFSVCDDGPGIAPQYHDKVFVMFQTLQPRDTLDTTGVGLSLVKKIVEERGGRVRVESAEGEGATFYFTWPRSEKGKSGS